jgi:hypothetical protein
MLLACGTASFHFPDLFFTPIALFQVGFSPAQASSSEGCGISDRRETERLTRAWVGIRFGMIAVLINCWVLQPWFFWGLGRCDHLHIYIYIYFICTYSCRDQ